MVELSVVRDLVAIFGVIAGFSYYVIVVNNTRKNQQLQLETRQAQLFSQFMFQFFTTEFIKQYFDLFEMDWDDYDDYWKKYSLFSNPDAYCYRHRLHEMLNLLGTYVKNDLIEVHLINQSIGGVVVRIWPKWRNIIEHERLHMYTPNYMEDFEYLYHEVIKYREKVGQEIDSNFGARE